MHIITPKEINLIKNRLREEHLTQEEMANYIGVSPITFSRWMSGKTVRIRDYNWKMLICKLGFDSNDLPGKRDDGLNQQEGVVSDKLAESWNEYLKLEIQHDDDVEEFRHAIHRLQHLVMIRQVRRNHSDWTNKTRTIIGE